ncbi:MAG: SET-like domain-containing protein [Halothiobacillaceae bacterium]|nr:MAG: SET-like domain-containing protein [Halothiobacillaceae bacterium]
MYPSHFEYNPLYPNANDFKVVRKDDTSGMGVVCYKSFAKGDLIAVIAGEIITDIRQHSLQIKPGVHLYDVHFSGYFLHSCSPNVMLDMKNLRVYATRAITPGDHLLMDYAQTEDVLFKQFPCSCGSKQCRGWITGKKEQIDEENPLYREFLSIKEAVV